MALSPAGWLERLERRLHDRWNRIRIFDAYYEGHHRVAFATAKWNEAFGHLFGRIADNWCEIIVDSSAERMEVQGFRFGRSTDADEDAWAMWQANNLDGQSSLVHSEAIKLGEAYWLVEPNGDMPRITAEHPSQVIVEHAPGDTTQRLAALKKWADMDGHAYANVYLPEGVAKFRSESELAKGGQTGGQVNWVRFGSSPNPLGEVPVVPVQNNPSMVGGGRSDLAVALPLQDALNKELSDMLIGSEYLAFPQRVVLGVEVPRDEDGKPLQSAMLEFSQGRMLTFENPDVKIDQFTAADLKNYTAVRDNLLRALTAKCRIPPHYVLGEITNASGDALKAAETGLVKKVRNKMPYMGEGHEEVTRLGFKAQGDAARGGETEAETIWANPENRSEAEIVDAAVKKQSLGVPWEQLMEDIGYSPQQIDRMADMRETEALLVAVNGLGGEGADEPEVPSANGSVPQPAAPVG